MESGFPFVKLITPENYVGFGEHAKVSAIVKIFEDAYKSPLSLIILDDIERLIEFIHIGPRFSNIILQALLVLIKKCPPNLNRKLMIIGTTSMKSVMQEMDLVDCFNTCLNVPSMSDETEIKKLLKNFSDDEETIDQIAQWLTKYHLDGIPIKNMILTLDIIKQKTSGRLDYDEFTDYFDSIQGSN